VSSRWPLIQVDKGPHRWVRRELFRPAHDEARSVANSNDSPEARKPDRDQLRFVIAVNVSTKELISRIAGVQCKPLRWLVVQFGRIHFVG